MADSVSRPSDEVIATQVDLLKTCINMAITQASAELAIEGIPVEGDVILLALMSKLADDIAAGGNPATQQALLRKVRIELGHMLSVRNRKPI